MGDERRVALVTGAAQGLGLGIASAFARAGYDVAIVDVRAGGLADAERTLRAHGRRVLTATGDVTRRDEMRSFVGRVVDELGRLDVLVNNAQVTRLGAVLDVTDDDLDAVWRSGFAGTLVCMQAAFAALAATGGCVVNLGSGAGLTANAGYAVYGATKEAIRTLTRVAALEWGPHGVRVNALSPAARTAAFDRWAAEHPDEAAGRIATIPLRRMGDPERDIGEVAVFLASEAASYITGATIVVDGGAHYLG